MPKDNYDTKSLANPITSNIKPLKPLKASKTQKVKAPTKTEQKEQKRLEREALIEQSAQQALDVQDVRWRPGITVQYPCICKISTNETVP